MDYRTSIAGTDSASPWNVWRRRPRVFYGWWIAATASLVWMLAYGVGVYGFVAFTKPLEETFGWSRSVQGGSITIFWATAMLTPFLGAWSDTRDPRPLVIFGAVLEGLGFFLIAHIDAAWQLFLLRALMGLGKLMMVLPIPVILSRWFSVHKGIAIAFAFSGAHLGGVLLAPLSYWLIASYGWRAAATVLAALLVVTVIPAVLVFFRVRAPADLGLFRDGLPGVDAGSPGAAATDDGLEFRQVVRHPLFWAIVGVTTITYFGYSAVFGQMTSYLTDSGISAARASKALGGMAGAAIVGVLGFGRAMDRFRAKTVLLSCLVLLAAGVSLLVAAGKSDAPWLLFAFIATFGVAIGGIDVVWVSLLAVCFGQRSFGAVCGTWYFFCLAMLTVGAIIAGAIYDVSHSYLAVFSVIIGSILLGAIVMGSAKIPPAPRPAASATG